MMKTAIQTVLFFLAVAVLCLGPVLVEVLL